MDSVGRGGEIVVDILSLDTARRTGWARGRAGQPLIYGTWELRKRGEPNGLALGELGRRLVKHVREHGKPDLMVIELFMPSGAQKSEDQVNDSRRLNGAANAIAGVYGIEVVEPRVQTVRAQVCGASGAGGREQGKQMVIDNLILRGLVPKDFKDADAADAICGLIYAEANFARRDSSFTLTAR